MAYQFQLQEFIANCVSQQEKGAPKTANAAGWIAHFLASQKWGLDAAFFEQRLVESTTLVMLDGLDEAPNRVDREAMARLFENATKTYGQCRFVVTTRPGTYTGESTLDGFEQVKIDDLEPEAVEGFLAAWSRCLHPSNPAGAEGHKKELVSALKAKPEIRRMARNPVMLTALAVVHWNERRMPEQRAELYESVLTWLARAREQRKGRETAERCLALLGQLALAMQDQKKGRLTEVAKGRAAEMLAPQFPGADGFGRAMSFLEQEETDSGIVVSRGGDVRFWHLTFQEYLAARAIAGLPDASQQKKLLASAKLYRPEWREVMRLLGGILLVKQGAAKVDGLFTAILDRLWKKPTKRGKPQCAGLLGSMLTDLRTLKYEPSDKRYSDLMESVLAVFTVDGAKGLSLKERVEAAEALGAAGDPRLCLPGDKDYWVPIKAKAGPFLIGKFPVTVEEYSRFVEDGGKEPKNWEDQKLHRSRPVVNVSWHDAKAYCEWAGVRLPTEAEWYAAAAGPEQREYPWGPEEPDEWRASYRSNVGAPSPVGLFPRGATPEGVHDMAGNVWEWMENDYERSKETRGGSWFYDSSDLRASSRNRFQPESRYDVIGFRCVREVFS